MTHGQADDSRAQPVRIGAEHPRYAAVVNKRFNRRFAARPDYVRLAASTGHVLTAVQEAVDEQRRLVVTSGGHCLDGFVSDPDVRVIIDVSPMRRVYYDQERRAVAVEAGATVGETFQTLWAHTGAGGGNLGIVTRYWFRSPGASGDDPATLLPSAPESISTFTVEWRWNDFDARSFERLVRNHSAWSEQHSGADSPQASLWTLLEIHRKQLGAIVIRGVSTAGDGAERQALEYLASLCDGVRAWPRPRLARVAWLDFALHPFPDLFTMPPGGVCGTGRRLRRRPDQPPGRRPGRPGMEPLGYALARSLLPGELPAPAAGEGAVGPWERVPASPVDSEPRLKELGHHLATFFTSGASLPRA